MGRKCPDNGIIDRILYVYWHIKEPILNLPGFENVTSLATYILWLRSPYKLDSHGRWPHSQQVRYNYFILVLELAQHYKWL